MEVEESKVWLCNTTKTTQDQGPLIHRHFPGVKYAPEEDAESKQPGGGGGGGEGEGEVGGFVIFLFPLQSQLAARFFFSK